MNLGEVLMQIETNTNRTERIISLAEVIVFLKDTKNYTVFPPMNTPWKDEINTQIVTDTHRSIDKEIARVKELLDFNIENE